MLKKLFQILFLLPLWVFSQQSPKTKISIIGTLHFNQFYDAEVESKNFLGAIRQQEFEALSAKLSAFHPDLIMVEREPSRQKRIDSLITFDLRDIAKKLPDGSSEVYQIGFRLAKREGLERVYGIDYYESVSQQLLEKGENLQMFTAQLKAFQTLGRKVTAAFLSGKSSVLEVIRTLNARSNIALSHRLLFNTPAYVINGAFKDYNGLETPIDTAYIGAEFVSIFYERNLKIYANIITRCVERKPQRVIVIIGQVHVGVLESLLVNNPNFELIEGCSLLE
ncbi:MAG: DUF5694 domain-containing protein [Bacteroidota bacterium]